jgi:hypothetical protein
MAQAPDILNTIADRLWSLFEAQTSITAAVLPGNRNKGNEEGWLRDFIANAPADERRMEIDFERGDVSLYSSREGFAKEEEEFDADSGCDFSVIRQQTAIIIYREDLPDDPGAHPIQRSIEQTLFLAGPTLGLSEVPANGLGKLTWEERRTRADEFPNPGRITTYRLPITTIQSALSLVGMTA